MKYSILGLAISLSLGLTACGGGSSGGETPAPDPGYEYQSYACDADLYEKAKELRIYQVMTEAFIDGDAAHDFGDGYGTSHHNGDLQGIIDSLDYIQDLGMNAIWMTPIFESTPISGQDHWADKLDATGYFASNYFSIDPNFGTMEQARTLVAEAHARGMYVLFDGVFGHHKGNVVASPNGLTPSGASNPVSYPGTDNDTLEFYKEVASYWVTELGIDGWRLDQAYQVPVGAWGEIRKSVEDASKATEYTMNGETVNPLGYMVGEIWRGENDIASQGYGTSELPGLCSNFDFPMRYRIVQTFAVEESGTGGRDASNLATGYNTHMVYPEHAVPNAFLGNHDLVRFGDLLQRGDIAQPNEAEYWQRHSLAYTFLASYSGPITMYYGEEIGDEVPGFADQDSSDSCALDGLCDDHVARSSGKVEGINSEVGGTPFTADANQQQLRSYITTLMNARSNTPALYKGERTAIAHPDSAALLVDHKQFEEDAVLVLINTSENDITISLSGEEIGSDGALSSLLNSDEINIASGNYSITIDALESQIFEIVSPTADGPQQGTGGGIIGTGPLADCNVADAGEVGPLGVDMWIRGNYEGGDGFGATPATHQFAYKGNNIYQVVIDEAAITSFGFKFAAADWSVEFATSTGAAVLGTEQVMAPAVGPGTESNVLIPETGRYVYSFEINGANDGGTMMISKCE